MVKKRTRQPRKLATRNRFPPIEKELHKRTRADLVALIVAIAREHAAVARELEERPPGGRRPCKLPIVWGLSVTRNWPSYGVGRERIPIRWLSGG